MTLTEPAQALGLEGHTGVSLSLRTLQTFIRTICYWTKYQNGPWGMCHGGLVRTLIALRPHGVVLGPWPHWGD